MPLAHFVCEAKKNTPALKTTIIDAEQFQPESRGDLKREMAQISEVEKEAAETGVIRSPWESCKYLKPVGDKVMCGQYISLCVKEKCQKKFMEADFFDFKKYLKQGRAIK